MILIHRLDEISDEEDLDLIPPRPVEDRCQCCGAVTWQGCIISWIVQFYSHGYQDFKQTVKFKCLSMVSWLWDCHQSWLKWQLNIAVEQIESCLSITHMKHFSNQFSVAEKGPITATGNLGHLSSFTSERDIILTQNQPFITSVPSTTLESIRDTMQIS